MLFQIAIVPSLFFFILQLIPQRNSTRWKGGEWCHPDKTAFQPVAFGSKTKEIYSPAVENWLRTRCPLIRAKKIPCENSVGTTLAFQNFIRNASAEDDTRYKIFENLVYSSVSTRGIRWNLSNPKSIFIV